MKITEIKLKLLLLIIGLAGFVLVFTWQSLVNAPISHNKYSVVFHFQPGMAASTMANSLHAQGMLRKPNLFLSYVKYHRLTRHLKAGVYEIRPNDTIVTLTNKLVRGDVIQYDFAIIEGWTVKELLSHMQSGKGLVADIDTEAMLKMMQSLDLKQNNPEGLFMPETYRYPHGFSAFKLLQMANTELMEYLEQVWQRRDANLPYQHWYQALIVASLVEKETMLDSERALIAGVILNRLANSMPLQIDASVIYGLGDLYDGELKRSQLKHPSPYNTYIEKGLPPTPIALPSRLAIEAALHPAKTDYLYYVANGQGGHTFSRTLAEHNQAVARYMAQEEGATPAP